MKKERGAIVVEATISLSVFMFTIFTILSLINMAYIQSRIGVALQSAAKELSQYSYLYYKLGMADIAGQIEEGGAGAKEKVNTTVESMGTMFNALAETDDNLSSGNFDALKKSYEEGKASVQTVKGVAKEIADNPKEFIVGMGFLAADTGMQEIGGLLGEVFANAFMRKNLKAHKDDDPDAFLKRHGLKDGVDSMNFGGSALMHGNSRKRIQLVVTYDIHVIKLLGFDYKFTIKQIAQTDAWGLGDTKIKLPEAPKPSTPEGEPEEDTEEEPEEEPEEEEEETYWGDGVATRGDEIIAEELNKYGYKIGGRITNGGFDEKNNQVVFVNTVDPYSPSYSDENKLKSRLKVIYNNAADRCNEETLKIEKNGSDAGISSDPTTRTKKLIIVIPENADEAYVKRCMDDAVASLGEEKNITYEIKKGYGKSKLGE